MFGKGLIFLILCLIFLTTALNVRRDERQAWRSNQSYNDKYIQNIFALTWPGEFCRYTKKGTQCSEQQIQKWDGASFTIHGFWPSGVNKDTGERDCLSQQPGFHRAFLSYELIEQMEIYWPELKKSTTQNWFWNHQWDKHGKCYAKYYLGYQSNNYEDYREIMNIYFQTTVDKLKGLRTLRNIQNKFFYSKGELAQYIQIEERYFYAICSGKYLSEIRICYSKSRVPGEEIFQQCPYEQLTQSQKRQLCHADIRLR